MVAQGDDAGAGQRGDVDHRARFVARGIGQCIAQNQATFRIGIQYLHSSAVVHGDYVARNIGISIGPVIGSRHQSHHPHGEFVFCQCIKCSRNSSGPTHITFHIIHGIVCGL